MVSDAIQKAVRRKLAKRICLGCGRQVGDEEQIKLGQCLTCYGGTYRALRAGAVEREELLSAGKIAEQPCGPKPKNAYTQALRAKRCSNR